MSIGMLVNRALVVCLCSFAWTWLTPRSGPARPLADRQAGTPAVTLGQAPSVPTVEDAVRMVRIQSSDAAMDGSVGAFSPDGSKFAAILWRGDPARNVNVYSLMLFEMGKAMARIAPAVLLSRDFTGDASNQFGSPISHLTFLGDNRTIAFIGRDGDAPAQVYTVHSGTRRVRQLTHHPSAVRAFVLNPDGSLRAFSAVAADPREAQRRARLEDDGVFAWDTDVFPGRRRFMTGEQAFRFLEPERSMRGAGQGLIRQYFLAGRDQPFFDSRQSRPAVPPDINDPSVASSPVGTLEEESEIAGWATLTGDAQGRHALLFPYSLTDHAMNPGRYRFYETMNAYARRTAAPYGLVDLTTGRIARLIDAPHPQFNSPGGGPPLWAADGRSVIVHTLLPLDARDAETNARRAAEPPQWAEVEVGTRRITPLGVPPEWRVLRWADDDQALVVSRGTSFGVFRRRGDRTWGELVERGTVEGFNSSYPIATNGRVAIGVKDATSTPPEFAAYDLSSQQTTILTDLNPALRDRRYAAVESMRWQHRYDKDAFAFLVKPVGYRPGTRYPLVILLDDGTLGQSGTSFLLDGAGQLSGHAIQMLAAQGFVVLYVREPASLRRVMGTPQEGEHMREHIESAVAQLDYAGLIDPQRIGISGWSRAGYHTDYLLMHAAIPFAAATQIDGGAREYTAGMRPFTDEELQRIRTPLLFEPHSPRELVVLAGMADRLDALGKPTDVLYFATASHSTTRPQHRLRSLSTHIDWWRFWLQDQEDPAPGKKAQYAHWRTLRERQTNPDSGSRRP
jgi:dipeptidyl aminopeptidase/acylaminoacyl peptidase